MDVKEAAALGFYEDTRGRLGSLLRERRKLLRKLSVLADAADGGDGGVVLDFDLEAAQQIMRRLAQIAPQVEACVRELNANAWKCGKPQLDLRIAQELSVF